MDESQPLDPLAKTALWTASMRAREHRRADRLFSDPLAETFAGDEGPRIMSQFEGHVQSGVEDPALAVRTRFLDDQLLKLDADGVGQFVFVAVGMDSRAFRLEWSSGVLIYELDRPALLSFKDDLVRALRAPATAARVPLGVDLLTDWTCPLLEAGFDPRQPTCWLVEGLLYFLHPHERDVLLHRLTDLSAAGSRLLADYVGQTSLDSPGMAAWRARMAEQGHPWKSGSDRPEEVFAPLGWKIQVSAYGDPDANYGRWSEAAVAPGMPGTRGRYLVIADKQ
ncbi:Putative S-adenosyl-L-methionine-dependent methyltransferase [Streptomyces sp. YIM 121038]|uniref:SAM-dependent methyltransferase n=1 Tax=Streptomyces sp. YIM 121038 TaxID=2136401 RepID=UPI001110062B|nr:SAM-dependent methyltransferase [Streptomyces sp. YIM 121038]QCX76295.1 Putative S-adenosyl-L-methionine-dependent methyltransferase [Streptomyces sp. YIM 121038]